MGILKAIGRMGSKAIIRSMEKKEAANAGSRAYEQTGQEMIIAKKQGRYINGSSRYKKNKSDNIRKARQKRNDREQFIDDLL